MRRDKSSVPKTTNSPSPSPICPSESLTGGISNHSCAAWWPSLHFSSRTSTMEEYWGLTQNVVERLSLIQLVPTHLLRTGHYSGNGNVAVTRQTRSLPSWKQDPHRGGVQPSQQTNFRDNEDYKSSHEPHPLEWQKPTTLTTADAPWGRGATGTLFRCWREHRMDPPLPNSLAVPYSRKHTPTVRSSNHTAWYLPKQAETYVHTKPRHPMPNCQSMEATKPSFQKWLHQQTGTFRQRVSIIQWCKCLE